MRTRLVGASLVMAILVGVCVWSGGNTEPVEALRPKAADVTDLIVANDWEAIRDDFDPSMMEKLSAEGLATAWESVVKEKGAFVSRGEPKQVRTDGSLVVFDTPMEFERGEMKSRVTLRANGKIAGLFILVPGAT